jgi:hypothetical protein
LEWINTWKKKRTRKANGDIKEKYIQNTENNDIGDIKTEIIEGTRSVACQSII